MSFERWSTHTEAKIANKSLPTNIWPYCAVWQGAQTKGYGQMRMVLYNHRQNKVYYVHRLAYMIHNRSCDIPDGY